MDSKVFEAVAVGLGLFVFGTGGDAASSARGGEIDFEGGVGGVRVVFVVVLCFVFGCFLFVFFFFGIFASFFVKTL